MRSHTPKGAELGSHLMELDRAGRRRDRRATRNLHPQTPAGAVPAARRRRTRTSSVAATTGPRPNRYDEVDRPPAPGGAAPRRRGRGDLGDGEGRTPRPTTTRTTTAGSAPKRREPRVAGLPASARATRRSAFRRSLDGMRRRVNGAVSPTAFGSVLPSIRRGWPRLVPTSIGGCDELRARAASKPNAHKTAETPQKRRTKPARYALAAGSSRRDEGRELRVALPLASLRARSSGRDR